MSPKRPSQAELERELSRLRGEVEELRGRAEEAEETLRALREGEVDALVISTAAGERIFTLRGADEAYRVIVEQMQEGAVTLAPDGSIRYANRCFAEMVGEPLERVVGSAFVDYVLAADRARFESLLRESQAGSARGEVTLCKNRIGRCVPTYLALNLVEVEDMVSICVVATSLSERKRAEELLASEQFVRRLIDNSPIGIAVVNRELKYQLVNPAFENIVVAAGRDPGQMTGRTVAEIFPPEAAEIMESCLRRVIESGRMGRVQESETPIRGRSWWDVREIPLHDAGGEVEKVLVLVEEVTQRKLAQEALRESERQFRALFEHAPDAVFLTMPDGKIEAANPAACAMFGMPEEELRRVGRVGISDPDDPRHAVALAERQRTGRIVDVELNYIRKNGARFPAEVNSVILPGEPPRSFVTIRDVSQRKRLEARLRRFYESGMVGLIHWRMDGAVTDANDKFLEMVGYDREDLEAGRVKWTQMTPPEYRARDERAIGELKSLGVDTAYEKEFIRKDGTRVPIIVGAALLDAEQTDGVAFVLDITDRKRMEQELQAAKESAERAKAAAEEASRAKDHFLAVLSHELRNPLTPVLATASMLQRDPRLSPEVREDLEMIRRNAELEARLIDDLLDLTRIARGKIVLNRRPVELTTVLARAVEVCRPDIDTRRLHFGFSDSCQRVLVNADAARLQQVFWNILRNAVKFTPKDGCIGIRCWREDPRVLIEVSDSGIGIEPEALTRVFSAFEQADRATTRQFGGLGLGLAISKALVELHGGTIAARSAGRNQGATFIVALPVVECVEAETPPDEQKYGEAVQQPMRQRILVVEDHGDTAHIMAQMLRRAGFEVRTAGDLASALEELAQQPCDLLISDLGLPDGSGLDLMKMLRSRGSTVPGIALSGYGQEEDVRRSREAGFAEHVIKPIEFEQLLQAARAVMQGAADTVGAADPSANQ